MGKVFLLTVFLIVLGIFVYFMPTIVAYRRGHFKRGTILLLNIFIGWSGLGWLVIMFWSATGEAYR